MDAIAAATRHHHQQSEMDFNCWMRAWLDWCRLLLLAAGWLAVGNWPALGWRSLPISSRSRRSRQHFVLQLETAKREAMIFVELPRTCRFPAEFL